MSNQRGEGLNYRSWVEVDLDNFTHNWNEMRRLVGPDVKILSVVKADAYGHGAIEISNVALKNGAYYLGVANADEGVQLRVGGIEAPILILSPSMGLEIDEIIKYNLIPSVSDLGFARDLQKKLKKAQAKMPIHIEVDTGMGRGGTIHSEAFRVIEEILDLPNIAVEGIFTHLSSSEVEGDDYNEKQWRLFQALLKKLEENRIYIPVKHLANSGGMLNFGQFHLDMVRPGIMSYGIYPAESLKAKADLLPVMSFKTKVLLLKEFPKGYGIGYNRTYVTKKPTRIATIPVGYGDGYGVIMSNQGEALIRGRRVPLVGRVSMDMCTLDVSRLPECEVGDEVVLLGRQGGEYIPANDIAAKAKTISYEVLCALGKRAPRVFIQKGRAGSVEPRLRRVFIPDEVKSISRIDNVIRRCFQTRARSSELGDAIYYEMFEALFGKEDRQLELRTNFRYNIKVADFTAEEKAQDAPGGKLLQSLNSYRVHEDPAQLHFPHRLRVEQPAALAAVRRSALRIPVAAHDERRDLPGERLPGGARLCGQRGCPDHPFGNNRAWLRDLVRRGRFTAQEAQPPGPDEDRDRNEEVPQQQSLLGLPRLPHAGARH